MKKVFTSEISKEDADQKVQDFILDGDITVINRDAGEILMGDTIVYVEKLTYEYSLVDIVDQIEWNIFRNQN